MLQGTHSLHWCFITLAAVCSCFGNLLIKHSRMEHSDAGLLTGVLNFSFIGGLVFYAINLAFFALALDRLPVTVAYPALAGLGFLFLGLTGTWLFNETLRLPQWIGLGLILLGISLLSSKHS